MAAILHKRKAANPSASDLTVGELAINTSDGGVFTKTSGGTVVEVSGAGSSGGENNQNAWTTFSVSGQDDVVADSATDTCTFVAGSNVTLTTNASGDSITFAAAGGVSSDAQENTVAGTNAGDSFTGTDAEKNTIFGYDSGTALTTGDSSSLYGVDAGKALTTGSYNTCIGHEAGTALTTSGYGVYIGYQAGKTYSSENQFGASALCVGAQAGKNSTGVKNTFIGTKCGQSSGSGSTNCYMGNETATLRTGSFNVGIGSAAFPVSGDGSNNVGIGFYVLPTLTSGSDNTALGDDAGDGLTTGSNCTFLGHNTAPSSATVSNEVTIGDANVTKFRVPGLGFELDTDSSSGFILDFGSVA